MAYHPPIQVNHHKTARVLSKRKLLVCPLSKNRLDNMSRNIDIYHQHKYLLYLAQAYHSSVCKEWDHLSQIPKPFDRLCDIGQLFSDITNLT